MRESNASWQKILAQGFTSVRELLEFLHLPESLGNLSAQKQFKTRIPRGFAALIEKGNPNDPILLQVLAHQNELQEIEGYIKDPLNEAQVNPIPGLIHKYHGRVLLTLTGACAIHCRYCFRRHFPYKENNPGHDDLTLVLEYIKKNPKIHEVILSGGDPLLVSDKKLSHLFSSLSAIPHVRTVRLHSRIPVVLPERITEELISILQSTRLHCVIVLHSNHAQELCKRVFDACMSLKRAGIHLLNQSVLLKEVNNDANVLVQLSHRLFECGVLPYYLHVLDKVQGASHFDIPVLDALSIFKELQHHLPGYLVPRLTREEPGQLSKTLLLHQR